MVMNVAGAGSVCAPMKTQLQLYEKTEIGMSMSGRGEGSRRRVWYVQLGGIGGILALDSQLTGPRLRNTLIPLQVGQQ